MTLDERIQAAHAALDAPSPRQVLVGAVLYTGLGLGLSWVYPWVGYGLLGLTGALLVALLYGAARYRDVLATRLQDSLVRPNIPLPLAGCRLVLPGEVLDLDTRQLLGSHHVRLRDLSRRTPRQAAVIEVLARLAPGCIVMADATRQVLLDAHGNIRAIRPLRD